jgi:hypothetical protein
MFAHGMGGCSFDFTSEAVVAAFALVFIVAALLVAMTYGEGK